MESSRPLLVDAASRGDLQQVKELLDDDCAPDLTEWCSSSELNPLHSACINNHMAVVQLLVGAGGQQLLRSRWGWHNDTAFLVACERGHVDMVKWMLDVSPDVISQVDRDGWTPLLTACCFGHAPVVQALLQHGADCTAASNLGTTPLLAAVIKGRVQVVKVLLDAKPDLIACWRSSSSSGYSPLHLACHHNHMAVAQLLVGVGGPQLLQSMCGPNGGSALHAACESSDVELLRWMLDVVHAAAPGNLINQVDKGGWTPLHLACYHGDAPMVQALLQHGAVCTAASNGGVTPLVTAARKGHVQVVKMLLDHYAKLDLGMVAACCSSSSSSDNQHNPLNCSACLHNRDMAVGQLLEGVGGQQQLLSSGLGGWLKDTVFLRVACEIGHVGMVKWMLDVAPDAINQVDKAGGRTPLHTACRSGHAPVVQALLQHGADAACCVDGYTPLLVAASWGHAEAVKVLLDAKPDLIAECWGSSSSDSGHRNPLHYACFHNHMAVVQLLVGVGGPQLLRSRFRGGTTLHYACEQSHVDLVKWMLDVVSGANTEQQLLDDYDAHGLTALHVLCGCCSTPGHVEIAECLLGRGADACCLSAPVASGWSRALTPLDVACSELLQKVPYAQLLQLPLEQSEQQQHLESQPLMQLCVLLAQHTALKQPQAMCSPEVQRVAQFLLPAMTREHVNYKAAEEQRLHSARELFAQSACALKQLSKGQQQPQ